MNYPKVSVIVVAYQAASDLRMTLSNLSRQEYPDLEVVVIDGGSTDSTLRVLEEFSALIGVSVSEPDEGIYDAMNKGLARATGDFVWYINAGDRIHSPRALREIFDEFGSDGDLYYGDTLIFSKEGKRLGLRKKSLPDRMTWRSFLRGMVVCHQSVIVRKSVAPSYDVGYRIAADVEWVLLCLRNAEKIVPTGRVLSEFTEGGISTVRRREGLRERYRIMKKYFGLLPTLWAHLRFVLDALSPDYRPYHDGSRNHAANTE